VDTVPESLWNDMKRVFQAYYYQIAGLPEYISTVPMKIRDAMVKILKVTNKILYFSIIIRPFFSVFLIKGEEFCT